MIDNLKANAQNLYGATPISHLFPSTFLFLFKSCCLHYPQCSLAITFSTHAAVLPIEEHTLMCETGGFPFSTSKTSSRYMCVIEAGLTANITIQCFLLHSARSHEDLALVSCLACPESTAETLSDGSHSWTVSPDTFLLLRVHTVMLPNPSLELLDHPTSTCGIIVWSLFCHVGTDSFDVMLFRTSLQRAEPLKAPESWVFCRLPDSAEVQPHHFHRGRIHRRLCECFLDCLGSAGHSVVFTCTMWYQLS